MKNPFRYLRERREEKARLRRLHELTTLITRMRKLEKGGLIEWDNKEHRLFVAQPLADVLLESGAARWRNFLDNAAHYVTYCIQARAWENAVRRAEIDAVRQRKKEVAVLTKAESNRIRRAARDSVSFGSIKVPEQRPFSIFVLADDVDDKEKKCVTIVGTYDPQTAKLEMEMFEDVRKAMKKTKGDD